MSDTSKATAVTKPTQRPELPRTINLALMAIGAQVMLSLVRAGVLWGYTGTLRQSLTDANAAKDKPRELCGSAHPKGCLDVAHQVQVSLIELTVGAVLISVAVMLCARKIRQGVRSSRTVFAVLSVVGSFVGFAGSPLSIIALSGGGPVPLLVVTALAGLAALAAVVLLFLPESTRFFPRPGADPARPGLGSMFRARPIKERKPPPATGPRSTAASRAAGRTAAAQRTPAGARAKLRADEAAVARGAQLARNRAKASKSRRTEL